MDYYFSDFKKQYPKQLKLASQRFGLSLLGVDLNTELSRELLSGGSYKELEEYFAVGCINGPFAALIEKYGFFKAMTSTHNDPSLFTKTASDTLKNTESIVHLAKANKIGAIAITDDIAGNRGLFFQTGYFVEAVLPVYRKISEIIKENGMFAFFHSDGDMSKVVEFLILAGYDCLHPVDSSAGQDIYKLREEFGERISFMGHVDIMGWDERRIKNEIAGAENKFENGGLIIGSTCGISLKTTGKLNILYPDWHMGELHQ